MATAVSGTGPTYVFLVMEALIDAAVHLGFPRHIAHDLVIETLEGSTLFAKQSGMHPAELRNMVTSPGGTSAAALHELERGRLRTVMSEAVWAAFRRTRRARATSSRHRSTRRRGRRPPSGDRPTDDRDRRQRPPRSTCARASLADLRAVDFRAADRDLWADEAALWDRLEQTLAGLDDAAWHLPGAAPSDAGGPGLVAGRARRPHRRLAGARHRLRRRWPSATGRWPSDDDYDGGDFDRYNERRRAPWTTMPAAAIEARLGDARPRLLAAVRALGPERVREHAAWGWVYMVLGGHYLDHLAVIEPWAEQLRARQVDGDPFVDDPRAADHAGFRAQDDARRGAVRRAHPRPCPSSAWTAEPVTPGWTLRDHVGHLADWAEEAVDAIDVYHRRGHLAGRPGRGRRPWNERHVDATRAAGRDAGRRCPGPLRRRRASTCSPPSTRCASTSCARRTAGRGPTTACTGTPASTWPCSVRGASRHRLAA